MTTYDFSPLFRTAIGFDRLVRLIDSAPSAGATSYPPYNIEKMGDDSYRLTMAVAGFGPEDIDVTVQENALIVTGRVDGGSEGTQVLHRGIAGRPFERRFALADHIVVESADLKNGLLFISVKRVVPEALKPRKIAIGSNAAPAAQIANDSAQARQAA